MSLKEDSMTATAVDTLPNIFSLFRYKDAPAAIEWPCDTFEFEKGMVAHGPDNTVAVA